MTPTSAFFFARRIPHCRRTGLTTLVSVDTTPQYRAIFPGRCLPNLGMRPDDELQPPARLLQAHQRWHVELVIRTALHYDFKVSSS